jgi:hypothetical protein
VEGETRATLTALGSSAGEMTARRSADAVKLGSPTATSRSEIRESFPALRHVDGFVLLTGKNSSIHPQARAAGSKQMLLAYNERIGGSSFAERLPIAPFVCPFELSCLSRAIFVVEVREISE